MEAWDQFSLDWSLPDHHAIILAGFIENDTNSDYILSAWTALIYSSQYPYKHVAQHNDTPSPRTVLWICQTFVKIPVGKTMLLEVQYLFSVWTVTWLPPDDDLACTTDPGYTGDIGTIEIWLIENNPVGNYIHVKIQTQYKTDACVHTLRTRMFRIPVSLTDGLNVHLKQIVERKALHGLQSLNQSSSASPQSYYKGEIDVST